MLEFQQYIRKIKMTKTNKLKTLATVTAVLGGLALASCTDKDDSGNGYSTRTSLTAGASVGGVDLSAVPGFSTSLGGFTIALSNGNTIATLTCPAGEVSFNTTNSLTCNNATGCDINGVGVAYSNPFDVDNDVWGVNNILQSQGEQVLFSANNFFDGDQYQTGLACIPSDQVSYWS